MPRGVWERTKIHYDKMKQAMNRPEVKEKLRIAALNQTRHPHTEQSKKLISLKNKGRKRTLEQRFRMSIVRIGKKHSKETKSKMSLAQIGKKHSLETRKKMSEIRQGIVFSNEHRNNLRLSHLGKSPWNKNKKCPQHGGENHSNWKGGVTSEHMKIRNSIETRLWREAIFSRDNWTCVKCNSKGGRLNAHHIKPFSKYPELRFAINNGMTLCRMCHIELHRKEREWNSQTKNSTKGF